MIRRTLYLCSQPLEYFREIITSGTSCTGTRSKWALGTAGSSRSFSTFGTADTYGHTRSISGSYYCCGILLFQVSVLQVLPSTGSILYWQHFVSWYCEYCEYSEYQNTPNMRSILGACYSSTKLLCDVSIIFRGQLDFREYMLRIFAVFMGSILLIL